MKRVIEDIPRPVRENNPEIPDWLEAIIAKLQAKKPQERFQSAKEIADLLGQHLAHIQQPSMAPQPATVIVPDSAKPADKSTDADTWKQIFEGTDYRRRLLQYAVVFVAVIPTLLVVPVLASGWIGTLGQQYGPVVFLVWLVVHIVWSAGFIVASGFVKN